MKRLNNAVGENKFVGEYLEMHDVIVTAKIDGELQLFTSHR